MSERLRDAVAVIESLLDSLRPIFQRFLREAQATTTGHQEVHYGSTAFDYEVNCRLRSGITQAFPGAGLISEEGPRDFDVLTKDLCFVVDPIDGTLELMSGRDGFAVAVAVYEVGSLSAGVLDFPAMGRRLVGVRGLGATSDGAKLSIALRGRPHTLRIGVSPSQTGRHELGKISDAIGENTLVPVAAASPKIAAVATGELDAALYLPGAPADLWDYAAASILLTEAEGLITSLGGSPIPCGHGATDKGGWLAAPRAYHPALLAAVQRVLPAGFPI